MSNPVLYTHTSWEPRYRGDVAGHVRSRSWTLDDIDRFVGMMPAHVREKLAEGPIDDEHPADHPDGDCRACAALDDLVQGALHSDSKVGNAAAILWDFHQGWDLHKYAGAQLGAGVETYLRCVLLYVLAGWDGERNP